MGRGTVGPWATELEGAAIINLAGALVDRRPTPANIELLTRSRVEPIRALACCRSHVAPRAVWIQASTLAIYGDGGEAVLDESSPPADGPPQMAGVAGPGRPPPPTSPPPAGGHCAPASCSTATPRRSTV